MGLPRKGGVVVSVQFEPGMYVDETYMYDVVLGDNPVLTCTSTRGTIKLVVPYDGQKLKEHAHSGTTLSLGRLNVTTPDGAQHQPELNVEIPADSLGDYLKQGLYAVWETKYAVDPPEDTLVSVTGDVFDGLDVALDQFPLVHEKVFAKLVSEELEGFVNDLLLKLTVWVPDLFLQRQVDIERELDVIRLQQQHKEQIFLRDSDSEVLISQSLAALANSDGGRILFGVDEAGQITGIQRTNTPEHEVRRHLETQLLKAALRCDPPVPVSAPAIYHSNQKFVARVNIPSDLTGPFRYNGKLYHRQGSETVMETLDEPPRSKLPSPSFPDVRTLLTGEDREDVMIVDGRQGIPSLGLGSRICGFINAGVACGLIVIRHLGTTSSLPGMGLFGRRRSALADLEAHLRQELDRCTPRLTLPPIAVTQVDDEQVGIVQVLSDVAPVALYDGNAYEWTSSTLQQLSDAHSLFARFLDRVDTSSSNRPGNGSAYLSYAELDWPICPPADLYVEANPGADREHAGPEYDVQRQSYVWHKQAFREIEDGRVCSITTPLRYALMQFEQQTLGSKNAPGLTGRLNLQFDDVVPSGLRFDLVEPHPLAKNLPVFQRTQVLVNLEVTADALFHRRRRMQTLRFCLSDVVLDEASLCAVKLICEDVGFRVVDTQHDRRAQVQTLYGIRSKNYCDLTLLMGLRCDSQVLNRELRFEQRIDRKHTDTGTLDLRIVLVGEGRDAAVQMKDLHMALHRAISQRLHYLRAE